MLLKKKKDDKTELQSKEKAVLGKMHQSKVSVESKMLKNSEREDNVNKENVTKTQKPANISNISQSKPKEGKGLRKTIAFSETIMDKINTVLTNLNKEGYDVKENEVIKCMLSSAKENEITSKMIKHYKRIRKMQQELEVAQMDTEWVH